MSRRAVLLFVALGVAWGIPYMLIKVAVESLSPAELVLARTALAAALLLPVAVARKAVAPAMRHWRWVVMFTIVEIAVPWVTLGAAEQRLSSSTTGLLLAAVPLVGLAVAFVSGRAERLTGSAWLGLALGVAGVAALVGLDVGSSDLGAVAALGVTVVGYAIGPAILARKLGALPGLGVITVALTLTSLGYVPVVLIGDGVPSGLPPTDVVVSVVLLATVCTAIAGAVVLDERVTAVTVVGFTLVVAGSYLVNRRPRRDGALRERTDTPTVGTAEPVVSTATVRPDC